MRTICIKPVVLVIFHVCILLCSVMSVASELEDVIYKKDGSILRGEMTEVNTEGSFYVIRLLGGLTFTVHKQDILRITKEEKIPASPQPIATQKTQRTTPIYLRSYGLFDRLYFALGGDRPDNGSQPSLPIKKYEPVKYRQSIHYGQFAHTYRLISNDYTKEYTFSGHSATYQWVYNQQWMLSTSLSQGLLESIYFKDRHSGFNTANDRHHSLHTDDFADAKATQFKSVALFSNHYARFHYYSLGGGLVFDKAYYRGPLGDLDEQTFGAIAMAGFGLNIRRVKLQLHYFRHLSTGYSHTVKKVDGAELTIGLRFDEI